MSSEFITALIGAVVGGAFTLVGSFGAICYSEHRAQVKAEQGRMFEAYQLLNELRYAMYPVRWYYDDDGENPHYVEDEEFAAYAEYRWKTTKENLRKLHQISMSITKNVDVAHDLYFLNERSSEEHLKALTERARLKSNPALIHKIIAVERKRSRMPLHKDQLQES